jgi:predicted 3-demethylubiquinone-9 3-methyltransferase (glyoxalase superfamily)
MQKITPFLWFDNQAEVAVKFYTSIFKDAKILSTTRYGDAGPGQPGAVMTMSFELGGQEFVALNGGPVFSFSSAISFVVDCENQAEVDFYWDKLLEGGQEQQCGWLTDKFGITWQIVPAGLSDLLSSEESEKSQRAMQAMLQMKKLDIEILRQAYENG